MTPRLLFNLGRYRLLLGLIFALDWCSQRAVRMKRLPRPRRRRRALRPRQRRRRRPRFPKRRQPRQ